MSTPAQNRYGYIDMARGIGIILVLLGHLVYTEPHVSIWIASFHMAMFFVLSGITLSLSGGARSDMKTRIEKKARTVIVPYLWFSWFFFLADIWNFHLEKIDEHTFMVNAISSATFYGKSVMWFLTALFLSHTMLIILQRVFPKEKDAAVIVCVIIIAVVCCFSIAPLERLYALHAATLAVTTLINMVKSVVRAGVVLPFVAAGYYGRLYLETHLPQLKAKPARIVLILCTFAAGLAIALQRGMVDTNNLAIGNPVLYYAGGFLGSIAVITFCTLLPDMRWLKKLGSYSFVIMAVHLDLYVLWAGLVVAIYVYGRLPYNATLSIVTTVVALILGSLIAHVIERKFPFLLGRKSDRQ